MIEKIPENPTNQINFTPVVPAEKKVKPLIIAILIIGVLVLGVGGVYLRKFLNKPKACTLEAKVCPDGSAVGRTGPNCEFALCPTQAPSTTTAPDETTNWKTYTNEKYGFEFKYPLSVKTEEAIYGDKSDLTILMIVSLRLDNYGGNLVVYNNKNNLDLETFYQKLSKIGEFYEGVMFYEKLAERTRQISDQYKAYYFKDKCGGLPCGIYIWAKGDKVYNYTFSREDEKARNIFDQILSTFKFLDQKTVDETGTWRTYRDEKLGFEFKYPPEFRPVDSKTVLKKDYYFLNDLLILLNRKKNFPEDNLEVEYGFAISKFDIKTQADDIKCLSKVSDGMPMLKSGEGIVSNGIDFGKDSFDGNGFKGFFEIYRTNSYSRFHDGNFCFEVALSSNWSGLWKTSNADTVIKKEEASSFLILRKILSTFKFTDEQEILSCTADSDCGLNICDCRAERKELIMPEKKVCTRVCPGELRCISGKCELTPIK